MAVGKFHFIHTIEVFHPYKVVNVERISIGPHRWCIVTAKEDDAYKNVLLASSDAFSEDEAFNICVGLTFVMRYTGRDADLMLSCKILTH